MIRLPSSFSKVSNGRSGMDSEVSPMLKNFGNGVATTCRDFESRISPRAISVASLHFLSQAQASVQQKICRPSSSDCSFTRPSATAT
ncbi:hypothetical protein FGO68_gene13092 [Halteria grandinella]|uniref:Uncharacterized protein n=1 Tax=Halteria grandinella TaxID=5974 RepID=A0A8J8SUY2_HALGN|nr:hypothetical protein FGO68_gene13092 [Halteria grandinella]